MKKLEIRKVSVTYCDYCGKELEPPYSIIEHLDGTRVDLCDDYREGEENCYVKYKKEHNEKKRRISTL